MLIILGTDNNIKSYDYEGKEIYRTYYDICYLNNIIINDKGEEVHLIKYCEDSSVKIWDFHSSFLLYNIKIGYRSIDGICLWNKNYLFVGHDNIIKIIDLNSRKIIGSMIAHDKKVVCLQKIFHPKIGECLISQGFDCDQINIWSNKE